MRIAAIDFETANESRTSACALGVAWIEGGRVVATEEHLIRPREMRFLSMNIAIHGIRPEDVADVAAFLASPDSGWVTGQLIDASGGSHL